MKRRDFLVHSALTTLGTIAFHHFPAQSQPVYKQHHTYKSWKSENIFLKGINAPVFQELDITNLKISGTIPPEIKGMYVRNGPNPMFKPESYNYPLEGDGMLHGIYFNYGEVSYKNRWIQTRGLAYERFEGKELSELKFKNYANTNIIAHNDKLLALYEIGLPYEITQDLETVGEWNFQGELEQSMTAHPKIDPVTGELHFYRYSFFNTPYLHYYIADKQGKIIRHSPIEIEKPVLIHDMAITENYAIFFDCPFNFNLEKAKGNNTPFVWQPEAETTVVLVNRHHPDQKPIYLKTEAFWVWHFMNAYETDNHLTIDFVYYPEMKLESNIKAMLSNKSNLQRMTIDLNNHQISQQSFDDRCIEFPIIDNRRMGQFYRFGYVPYIDTELLSQKRIPNYFPSIIQYDMTKQTHKIHQFKPGCYGGEPAFIPHPNKTGELDGYVVTFVYNENTNTSDLLILDPANFDQEPIGIVHLPVRVPSGFHGNWIAA